MTRQPAPHPSMAPERRRPDGRRRCAVTGGSTNRERRLSGGWRRGIATVLASVLMALWIPLTGCGSAPAQNRVAAVSGVAAGAGSGGRVVADGAVGTATGPADPTPDADRTRILVTLPQTQRASWDRITAELSIAYSLRVYQAWRMRSLPVRCVIFDLPPGASFDLVLRRLAADPRVESAEPIRRYRTLSPAASPAATAAPAPDPYGHLQHGPREMRVGLAHRWATGRGVRVAVVDTGVDIAHPDLDGRIVAAHNFVDRGERSFTRDVHGTAVAGVVAASAGNGAGISGVAPGSFVMALKACWPAEGEPAAAECDSYTLAKALDWGLAEGAQVVNLSLTGPADPLLARLLDAARAQGVPVVAAAEAEPGFPATHPGVIAVRSAGPGIEPVDPAAGIAVEDGGGGLLAAPGVDVLTTVPGGGYEFVSGSSMAAAHVSGVVALLLERRPNLRPDAVARLLRSTSRSAGAAVPAEEQPAAADQAVIDACGALAELVGQDPDGCAEPVGVARDGT